MAIQTGFQDLNDSDRNDLATEHIVCSLCQEILTRSAILNPSRTLGIVTVDKPIRVWSPVDIAGALRKTQKWLLRYTVWQRQRVKPDRRQ